MPAPQSMQPDSAPPSNPASDVANIVRWDSVLARFLRSAGLFQTLRGFENDMLVLNEESEKEDIIPALEQFRRNLTKLLQPELCAETAIEERKQEYVHLAHEAIPVSQTQLTRSISTFLAQNRARNNASNRNEFLRKRRRLEVSSDGSSSMQEELSTCARTDAIPINRDVQMKYDIARNEDGPLRRTIKSEPTSIGPQQHKSGNSKGKGGINTSNSDVKPTLRRHPGLTERFANLESHLAVRYVPSPPESLLDRIKFLEDHITRLERDYPPWAALHFSQPNRGWPPPPRSTPLIVPSHLTSASDQPNPAESHSNSLTIQSPIIARLSEASHSGGVRSGSSKPKPKAKSSSLHRAVMERLEVKKALAGED